MHRCRRILLLLSILTNLSILFFFKYWVLFSSSINSLTSHYAIIPEIPQLNLLLPVGISFYTFQSMSYSIDVYNGKRKAEKHFGIFALYVCFFPQLIAGPIEKSSNLIPQFYKKMKINYHLVSEGLKRIVWGLFKKIVIADRLSIYVDAVFNNIDNHSSPTLLIATIFFSFQIYCDFSGYCDIAIGSAKVLGFNLMENFERPYFSTSVKVFWSRWHISLSSWFRDYIYIPLGGNRTSTNKSFLNIFIVFLVSGLWHGSNWTFVFWGAIHGIYLIVGKLKNKILKHFNLNYKPKTILQKITSILTTFSLTTFAWIFFRVESISDSFLVIKKLIFFKGDLFLGNKPSFAYSLIAISILFILELRQETSPSFKNMRMNNYPLTISLYCFFLLMILLIGSFDGGQFIYFQF